MTYTRTIKPSDVYFCRPTIPPGKKVVAFYPPKLGQTVLEPLTKKPYVVLEDYLWCHPRLILEDVPLAQEDWWE